MELNPWTSTIICLAVVLILLVIASGKWTRKTGERRPPELPSLPIVGSLPFIGKGVQLKRYFMERSNDLGKVFGFYLGSRYAIVLNGRKAIHDAMAGRPVDYADRPPLFVEQYGNMNPEIKGLTLRCYDADFRKYHLLTLTILKEFGFGHRIMQMRILEEVESLVGKLRKLNGRPTDPSALIYLGIANVISAIVFGRSSDDSDVEMHRCLQNVSKFFHVYRFEVDLFPILRFLPYYRRLIAEVAEAHRFVVGFAQGKLEAYLKAAAADGRVDESFVGRFIEEEGQDFDRMQLTIEIRGFMLAGVETASTTMRWALIYVANKRQVQDRIHAELDKSVPWKTSRRLPTLDDQSNLAYLDATILEVMRIRTVLPLSLQRMTRCDTEASGFFVPASTIVLANLYSAHMDPDEWKDPEEFIPERFLDEKGEVTGRDRVIPFGVGKRSCLGEQLARQELFLFMAGLLQQFDVLPPGGAQSHIDVTEHNGFSVSPSDYQVRFVPRFAD